MSRSRRPSPAFVLALAALVVTLGGTALASGVLNKKKVNKIITNRAPGLSVAHAATAGKADSATAAQSAANADSAASVGGISFQPISLALTDPTGSTPVTNTGGDTINAQCAVGFVILNLFRGASGAPMELQILFDGAQNPLVEKPNPNSGISPQGANLGVTATIREASGQVSRVSIDAFYEADAFGGPQDCFIQGTTERFG